MHVSEKRTVRQPSRDSDTLRPLFQNQSKTHLKYPYPRDVMLDLNFLESFAFPVGPVCARAPKASESADIAVSQKTRSNGMRNSYGTREHIAVEIAMV